MMDFTQWRLSHESPIKGEHESGAIGPSASSLLGHMVDFYGTFASSEVLVHTHTMLGPARKILRKEVPQLPQFGIIATFGFVHQVCIKSHSHWSTKPYGGLNFQKSRPLGFSNHTFFVEAI